MRVPRMVWRAASWAGAAVLLLSLSGATKNSGQDSVTGATVVYDPLPEGSGGFGQSVSGIGTGLLVRAAAATYATRTLVAGSNINITNADGVGGNPTISGVPAAGSLVYQNPVGNAVGGLVLGGVCYLTSPGVACSGTEQFLGIADRASTARNLRCQASTGPGGARVSTFTVRKNGADTGLLCTLTGAATTCSDTTHTFSVLPGDVLSISDAEQLLSGLSRPICSFVMTN